MMNVCIYFIIHPGFTDQLTEHRNVQQKFNGTALLVSQLSGIQKFSFQHILQFYSYEVIPRRM